MNNSKALYQDFVNQVTLNESADEISSIAYLVFENIFNCTVPHILADGPLAVTPEKLVRMEEIIRRLNKHEPLQYILDEANFYGRKFKLNSAVLIPRPETEELVHAIIDSFKDKKNIFMLDIGTGSGCIAITLALEIAGSTVYAVDISEPALHVAKQNASNLSAAVSFSQLDILAGDLPSNKFQCIVSNPPYITTHEINAMHANVLDYEPHAALFVPDDAPLLFYRAITTQAGNALKLPGTLFFEVNAAYGNEVATLLIQNGFTQVQVIKDLSGNDRIVKGILTSRNTSKKV